VYPIVKKISLIPLTKPRSERLKKKKSDSKEKWQHLLGCHFYKLGRALAFSERPSLYIQDTPFLIAAIHPKNYKKP
jgi:hypothetical protein